MAQGFQPRWFKSSYSGSPNDECVECAIIPGHVLVRDSTDPEGASLTFSRDAWTEFTGFVRARNLLPG